MTLRIGYISSDAQPRPTAVELLGAGCNVVRVETGSGSVLKALLAFIGEGEELVVPALSHVLHQSPLQVLDRLDQRRAFLRALQEDFTTRGEGGRILRAVLTAVQVTRQAAPQFEKTRLELEVRQLHSAGFRPSEIANRLGISRMTVWRKLRRVSEEG
ncbi:MULTISPECIES: helix-turn-helix domain-containing protein [unclassified Phenylobacterium]|jgi:DNA invertase Pin-like site-specific DNA recombinase|uniref:helix-turn-helix domain-containing protein n=1 Tax=unclassified Phenylobacterium TaxID=2640670 RepID=UPI0009E869C5|nr:MULTISPECIES: helix-turn-helix domain-containing protein [unclassified Phenylobacterium]